MAVQLATAYRCYMSTLVAVVALCTPKAAAGRLVRATIVFTVLGLAVDVLIGRISLAPPWLEILDFLVRVSSDVLQPFLSGVKG